MQAPLTQPEPTLSILGLVNAPAEEFFDRLTRLAVAALDADSAAISFFDPDSDLQFVKSRSGRRDLPMSPRCYRLSASPCRHVLANQRFVTIADLKSDELTCNDPRDVLPNAAAYLAVPVPGPDHNTIGSFYVLARQPREWSAAEIRNLSDLAYCVSDQVRLRVLQCRLRERTEGADNANQAKSAFLANMSHELRTPLNAVLGMASVLGQTGLTGDQRQMLRLMEHAGTEMLVLIDDLLDLARIEAGVLNLKHEPFRPDRMIAEVCTLLAPHDAGSGPSIVPDTAAIASVTMLGASSRIRQVVTNLLGNALKFTTTGSVTVRGSLVDATGGSPDKLAIAVIDTGPGVPDAAKEMIFQRFAQSDAAAHRNSQGLGLGLAIAKAVCDQHGGSLSVQDTPGGGATFLAQFGVEVPGR